MNISLICDCIDIPPLDGVIRMEIADGGTLRDMLVELDKTGLTGLRLEELLRERLYLCNRTVAQLDTPLHENDRVMILKAMAGG